MFLSLCGIGFLPYRIGAGVAIILTGAFCYGLHTLLPADALYRFALFVGIFLVVFVLGAKMIPLMKEGNTFDHHWIVIDEFLGVLLAFIPLLVWRQTELTPISTGALVFLFGFFDHFKPLGIRNIDAMEDWPPAVMLDDCVAGIYTAVIYHLLPTTYYLLT